MGFFDFWGQYAMADLIPLQRRKVKVKTLVLLFVFLLGGCTPPTITIQYDSVERASGGALIRQYRDPSGIWVFPARGPVENCTLYVYQDTSLDNRKGRWLPASTFFNGVNLWYYNGAAYVADYDSLLWKRKCTKWEIKRRVLPYGEAK